MEDLKPKRWTVTYTKHIKQKRKVYQDGFLDLHTSTNKAMLYDDCEKLLECRLLKKDEVVSSGEMLTFNAYLIDVGDPEGDHKPTIPDLKFQGRDKKITEKFGSLHRKQFRNTPISTEDRKTNAERNKARPNNLSPSQKIIREFKKSELHKYGAPQSSPDITKPSIQVEWTVLYTTQVTQKAKKYHDGFLRLEACGSLGRQVMLFDPSRKLLDSRFLKKDEVIRSGESIALDAHLVDIGECEGNHEPLVDLNVQRNSCSVVGKAEIMLGQHNCLNTNKFVKNEFKKSELHKHGAPQSNPDTTKSSITEWQVLYTTQVTQKGKKYHDGFLRLAICGSLGRQLMLYDASRKLLDSRFLKKEEVIRSGESIAFDTHLVDVGEPEGSCEPLTDLNVQGNNCNAFGKTGIMHGKQNYLKVNKSVVKEWHALYTSQLTQKAKKYHNGILRLAFRGSYQMQVTLLNEDKTTLSSKYLSLSEDVKTGSTFALPKYLVEVGEPCTSPEEEPQNNACPRKDSDSNIGISSVDNIKLSKRVPVNKPSGKPQNYACSGKDVDSNFSVSRVDEIKLTKRVPANQLLRDAHQILSFLQKPMAQESIVADIERSITRPASSSQGHRVSNAATLDFPEDSLPPRAYHEPSENVDIRKSSDLISSKAISNCNGSQLSMDAEIGNSHQPYADSGAADTKWQDEDFAFCIPSSSAHDPDDNESKSSEEFKSAMEINTCPSFDLGF